MIRLEKDSNGIINIIILMLMLILLNLKEVDLNLLKMIKLIFLKSVITIVYLKNC